MKDISVIGVDIAKNVFQVHGSDAQGKKVYSKRTTRDNFIKLMLTLPKVTVGIEACGGANYWAKKLGQLGFTVKLMSPFHVKKYTDRHQKNDARDAAACAEAVTRDSVRYVPIKTDAQCQMQSLHRVRSHYVKQRTALMNMIRGLLLETGIAIRKGQTYLIKALSTLLEAEDQRLCAKEKSLLRALNADLDRIDQEVDRYTAKIMTLAKEDPLCKRLQTIQGIGPLSATALLAKIGNGSEFQKGRDLSAYLGLVPRQCSTGGQEKLMGITKHGDRYLRQLLIHGGRSCVQAAYRMDKTTGEIIKTDEHSIWIRSLADRVGVNKASVAVANKNARIVIALLKSERVFQSELAH